MANPPLFVSKIPPNRAERMAITPEEWWVNPLIYVVNGQKYKFYAVRHVAAALHRAAGTIRRWERAKAIPPPLFYKTGLSSQGSRRLYTRRQIQLMLDAANEVGLAPGVHPQSDQIVSFGAKVKPRWAEAGVLTDMDRYLSNRFEDEEEEEAW